MPRHVDSIVIGGGLLGSAVAFYLSRAGAQTVLVEKNQINTQASGRNAGSLHFQLEYRMIEHGMEAARKAADAMPLHLDAAHAWMNLAAELGEDVGVVQSGGMMLAETPEQVSVLEAKAVLERDRGLESLILSGEEVRRKAPYIGPSVLAASYCPLEGKADPRQAALVFSRAAMRLGAEIRSGCKVVALKRIAGGWRVETSDGQALAARTVAIAAGAWSGRIARMLDVALPVSPIGLMMTATAKVPSFIKHLIQHAGRRLSMKQSAEGTVLIGGGWPARLMQSDGVVDLDTAPAILPDMVRDNMRAALAVVPAVANLPVLRIWSGTTALIADQLPLLGAVPRRSGVFIATGGSAFTLGPTYARILAGQMLGKPLDFDVTPYDPIRFGSMTNA